MLELLTPARWVGAIDGVAFDGEYLLFEVLNTGAIGPNLALAPGATPHDGQFTIVAAGANEREALAAMKGLPAEISVADGIRAALKLLSKSS